VIWIGEVVACTGEFGGSPKSVTIPEEPKVFPEGVAGEDDPPATAGEIDDQDNRSNRKGREPRQGAEGTGSRCQDRHPILRAQCSPRPLAATSGEFPRARC
jgi:hypothetical protein